jgi:hypothetical protein
MAKRFTDTGKYKKAFIRSLPGPYKLLWDYLYHDCDHAGIWEKDFEVAQIRLGKDMPVNEVDALKFFNTGEERIRILNGGSKWFIFPFISFQYGELNPQNRLHFSILSILSKEGIKGLVSPLQGAKDKDKDKDKEKEEGGVGETDFDQFWKAYPKKKSKGVAERTWKKIKPGKEQVEAILKAVDRAKKSIDWLKDSGQFIPYPATWLNSKGWEDDVEERWPEKPADFKEKMDKVNKNLMELAERSIKRPEPKVTQFPPLEIHK